MPWNPSAVVVGVTIQRRRYVCTNNVKYQFHDIRLFSSGKHIISISEISLTKHHTPYFAHEVQWKYYHGLSTTLRNDNIFFRLTRLSGDVSSQWGLNQR